MCSHWSRYIVLRASKVFVRCVICALYICMVNLSRHPFYFSKNIQFSSNNTFHGSTAAGQKISILIYQALDLTFIRLVPSICCFISFLVGNELCYPHSHQATSGKQWVFSYECFFKLLWKERGLISIFIFGQNQFRPKQTLCLLIFVIFEPLKEGPHRQEVQLYRFYFCHNCVWRLTTTNWQLEKLNFR